MRYGSVCSGIESCTVAWHTLGWEPAFFAETEKFPSAVLAHRFPETPNHGDFTTIEEGDYEPIELLVGGTPCQSFSVAGKRLGLDDPRGNLALEYLALARRLQPRWLVFENVPGLLSLDGGRAFAAFLQRLGECGYGYAYRVLDAQYIRVDTHPRAVPQRRRRVLVVGYLGDWRPPAAVLFEPEGLRGDSAPRREAGQGTARDTAPSIGASGRGFGRAGETRGQDPVVACAPVSAMLNAAYADKWGLEDQHVNQGCPMYVSHSLRADGFDASEDGTGRGTPLVAQAVTADMYRSGGATAGNNPGVRNVLPVAFDTTQITSKGNYSRPKAGDPCHPLAEGGHPPAVAYEEDQHANAEETGPLEALQALRDALGAEATCEWQAGVLASFSSTEILQSTVRWIGAAEKAGCGLGDGALSRAQRVPTGAMREVWKAGRERRAPRRRGLSEQLVRQLDEALSELPHEAAPPPWLMQDLRRPSEGDRVLQSALHSTQGRAAVRRLTPVECERLMGFPDDWTLIPWRKGMAPDGPRYKALGNAMAVNCMRWIGLRIELCEQAMRESAA